MNRMRPGSVVNGEIENILFLLVLLMIIMNVSYTIALMRINNEA